ncbi:MAG: hypothetical protein ACRYGM_15540 [Janthinobacterium lividum]
MPHSIQVSVPFPVLAGVDEAVPHPSWTAALDSVRSGLSAGALVVLTGEAGLGKSLLLRTLRRDLEQEGEVVVLLPGDDAGAPAWPSSVVLVDGADRVPARLLQYLAGHAGRCVLTGGPGLHAMLGEFGRTPMQVALRPLTPDEVGPYFRAQVERAGLPEALLGPDTLAALASYGRGVPQRLQKLANQALFHARMDDADVVSPLHVAEAARRDGSEERQARAYADLDPAPAVTEPELTAPEPAFDLPSPPEPPIEPPTKPAYEAPPEPAFEPQPVLAFALAPTPVPAATFEWEAAPRPVPAAAAAGSPLPAASRRSGPVRAFARPAILVPGAAACALALAALLTLRPGAAPPTVDPAPAERSPVTAEPTEAPALQATAPHATALQPVTPQAVAPQSVATQSVATQSVAPQAALPQPFEPEASDAGVPPSAPQNQAQAQAQATAIAPVPDAATGPEVPAQTAEGPALVPNGPEPASPATDTARGIQAPAQPSPAQSSPAQPSPEPPAIVAAAGTTPVPRVAAASLPRPPTTPVHVVVTFARADAAAGARAVSLVSALQEAGTDSVLGVGPNAAREPAVTYFYPDDQAAAARLARQIGEAGRERLATASGLPPRPGTIRLLISPRTTLVQRAP